MHSRWESERNAPVSRSEQLLAGLFPSIGPWAAAALWFGVSTHPVPASSLDAELDLIHAQRLTPLLLRYLRENDPDTLAKFRSRIDQAAFSWAMRSNTVLALGVEVSELLEAHGIPNVVVKGASMAAYYPAWQDRPFGDVDLYVEPQRFAAALGVCAAQGWLEADSSSQPRRYFDRFCREAVNLRKGAEGNVDIHHHVPPWFWSSSLDAAALISRGQVQTLLGRRVRVVPPEDNLLIAALHVVSDKNEPGRTLLIWRDLVELARVVDAGTLRARAEQVGLLSWVRVILQDLPPQVRPTELIRVLESDSTAAVSKRGSIRGRARLRVLLSRRAAKYGVVLSQPLRLPVVNGVLFLWGMLFPSVQFLTATQPNQRYRRIHWFVSFALHSRGHD